jgi:hypothetical protein
VWGMVMMVAADLVLVSARHQDFEPIMLGYPGEGPSSANRKEARAQEHELRTHERQESSVVLEDVDTDDEYAPTCIHGQRMQGQLGHGSRGVAER